MNRNLLLLGLIAICLFEFSCIDPITIKAESDDRFLVIDGFFSTANAPHNIKLSYTRDVGATISAPELNAQVTIVDGQGNTAEYIEQTGGVYTIDNEQFRGEEGETYYIEIALSNGKKYQTAPQIIPKRVEPVNIDFAIESEAEVNDFGILAEKFFINIYVDTPLKKEEEELYFRWRTDEMYIFADKACGGLDPPRTCYVPIFPEQEIVALSGKDFVEGTIENIKVFSKQLQPKMREFGGKHYYNVYQQSINKIAFDYLEDLNKVALQTGSIFDAPPALIRGNVFNMEDPEELVLGFFEVSAIDTIRTFVRPTDFEGEYEFLQYCKNTFPDRYTPDCCECLLIDGSTTERPDYF